MGLTVGSCSRSLLFACGGLGSSWHFRSRRQFLQFRVAGLWEEFDGLPSFSDNGRSSGLLNPKPQTLSPMVLGAGLRICDLAVSRFQGRWQFTPGVSRQACLAEPVIAYKVSGCIWVVPKIKSPVLVPLNLRCRNIIMNQNKPPIILGTAHIKESKTSNFKLPPSLPP